MRDYCHSVETTSDNSILSSSAWSNIEWKTTPYSWAVINNFIELQLQKKLASEFPMSDFQHMRRRQGSDKCYEAWFRAIRNPTDNASNVEGLSDSWQQLVLAVESSSYRENMSKATGIDLKNDLLEITMWQFGPEHFLDPHTDIPAKRLAHLIYFNDDWETQWGGCFRVLQSKNIEDKVYELAPNLDKSLMFIRSDKSWHGVSRLNAPSKIRKVLQISFWKKTPVQGLDLPGLEIIESNKRPNSL